VGYAHLAYPNHTKSDAGIGNASEVTIVGDMAHKWVIVKNATKGGHRNLEDFQAELEAALDDFEAVGGFKLDRSVRETLGASEFRMLSQREKIYSHPFPHLSSHGDYLFGCYSVPADIDNGTADFSSLFIIATDDQLLTVFKDPAWVYNGTFGGAVLALYGRHSENGSDRVASTILKLAGFTIAALDHTFDALGNRSKKYEARVQQIAENDGKAIEGAIARHLPSLTILKDEIVSLSTVTGETVEILRRIEGGRVMLHPENEDAKSFFNRSEIHYANGLYVHAAQINSFRLDLTNEISDSIVKLDRLQDKALVLATHRVTALGAMILFPNLIYDFFGQSFAPLPDWIKSNGWWFTVVLTTAYWIGQYAYMRRRRYI